MEPSVFFSAVFVVLYGACLFLGFKVVRMLYGGRFTLILPPMLGAISVLLLVKIFQLFAVFVSIGESTFFIVSVQTLYLVAGILLMSSLLMFYQISYATAGFLGEK